MFSQQTNECGVRKWRWQIKATYFKRLSVKGNGKLEKLTKWKQQIYYFYFFNFIYSFIYFWLRWVFVAVHGLSRVAASEVYPSLRCASFSLRWLLLLRSKGSRHAGFSCCGTRAQQLWLMGSRVLAQQLWRTGLAAPWHVGSSQTRAQTRVPCTGRWILNHCATREVQMYYF